ncbi:hypothetical protein [Candidatus Blastococcus massiliensis]|uniref:hypothetical protein n=1 Tax=Candidatus Blastococcus massiliensis TaxID=1470358 RepID=UPI0004BCFB48|nr:hypothetical protein [Candidatus Blastococcus massiliensis]
MLRLLGLLLVIWLAVSILGAVFSILGTLIKGLLVLTVVGVVVVAVTGSLGSKRDRKSLPRNW